MLNLAQVHLYEAAQAQGNHLRVDQNTPKVGLNQPKSQLNIRIARAEDQPGDNEAFVYPLPLLRFICLL